MDPYNQLLSLGNSCGYPGEPQNGKVVGEDYSFGKLVNYTCNKGYNLIGDTQRECLLSGRWTGSVPKCQSKNPYDNNFKL